MYLQEEAALGGLVLFAVDPLVLGATAIKGPALHALELERKPRPDLLLMG